MPRCAGARVAVKPALLGGDDRRRRRQHLRLRSAVRGRHRSAHAQRPHQPAARRPAGRGGARHAGARGRARRLDPARLSRCARRRRRVPARRRASTAAPASSACAAAARSGASSRAAGDLLLPRLPAPLTTRGGARRHAGRRCAKRPRRRREQTFRPPLRRDAWATMLRAFRAPSMTPFLRDQSRRPRRLARRPDRTRRRPRPLPRRARPGRTAPAGDQIASLRERLGNEKLVVAFVAEFSRGKSELINAIFFADTGRRILPATPGPHDDVPGRARLDAATSRPRSPLLPIETRLEGLSLGELRTAAARLAPLRRCRLDDPDQLAQLAARGDPHRVGRPRTQARALGFWDDAASRRQPAARRRRQGRGAGLAPRARSTTRIRCCSRAWSSSTRRA